MFVECSSMPFNDPKAACLIKHALAKVQQIKVLSIVVHFLNSSLGNSMQIWNQLLHVWIQPNKGDIDSLIWCWQTWQKNSFVFKKVSKYLVSETVSALYIHILNCKIDTFMNNFIIFTITFFASNMTVLLSSKSFIRHSSKSNKDLNVNFSWNFQIVLSCQPILISVPNFCKARENYPHHKLFLNFDIFLAQL